MRRDINKKEKKKAEKLQRAYYNLLTKTFLDKGRNKSVLQRRKINDTALALPYILCAQETLQGSELLWAISPVTGQQPSEVMGKQSYLRFLLSSCPSGIIFHTFLTGVSWIL